jgi:hypothetical protein
MSVGGDRVATRLLASIVAVVMAVSVAACGDDDDGGGSGSAQGATQASQGADEQDIKGSLDAVRQAFNDRDWAAVCDVMSAQTQKQFKQLEGYGTCPKAVADLYTDDATGKPTNDAVQKVTIASIDVNGNEAVVTGTQFDRKEKLQALLVKEGDAWKVNRWFDDNN